MQRRPQISSGEPKPKSLEDLGYGTCDRVTFVASEAVLTPDGHHLRMGDLYLCNLATLGRNVQHDVSPAA